MKQKLNMQHDLVNHFMQQLILDVVLMQFSREMFTPKYTSHIWNNIFSNEDTNVLLTTKRESHNHNITTSQGHRRSCRSQTGTRHLLVSPSFFYKPLLHWNFFYLFTLLCILLHQENSNATFSHICNTHINSI